MDKILGSPIAKYFYWIITLLIILIILLRYFVLPYICGSSPECEQYEFDSFKSVVVILDNLLVTVLVTVGIGSLIFQLYPRILYGSTFKILQPLEIGRTLEKSMETTDIWKYKGGTGTYLKAVTLPKNAEYANKSRKYRDITLEILDPTNEDICRGYSDYRNAVSKAKKDNSTWNISRVRRELYATILTVIVLKSEVPLLRIKLGLASSYSSFRYDLSSHLVVITNEDPRFPAIKADKEHHFYGVYQEEIRMSFDQTKIIPKEKLPSIEKSKLNSGNAIEALKTLNLFIEELTDEDLEKIIEMTLKPHNPYA